MNDIEIYTSTSHDPWFNLATENWLFQNAKNGCVILYLWRNQPCVVIGRAQNPWVECQLEQMRSDDVLLARRQSGGGTVYHDLGNTNFTFISPLDDYNKSANSQIIIDALSDFGIDAYASGRNDICLDDPASGETKKISGSAFRQSKDKAFHHGTLLINADLQRLSRYLTPSAKKLQAKGVKSVRSRVANLQDYAHHIEHDNLCTAIVKRFCQHYQKAADIITLDHKTLAEQQSLLKTYHQYQDWEWRYGRTLPFTHQLEQQFEWGNLNVLLDVKKGMIQQAQVHSDCLYPDIIDTLAQQLQHCPYRREALAQPQIQLEKQYPQHEPLIKSLFQWLAQSI